MGINQTIKHKAYTVVPVDGTPKNSKYLTGDLNVPLVADQ